MQQLQTEALKLIQDTAIASSGAKDKVQLVPVPGSKIGEFAAVKPNGEFEFCVPTREPVPRKHGLLTVGQVGTFVKYATENLDAKPIVWYGTDGVHVVLNDGKTSLREDVAFVSLRRTKAHDYLIIAADNYLPQKQFIRLLRLKLSDCLRDDEGRLIKILRLLNFKEGQTGYGKVEQGRESMGHDIEAEVTSDMGPIPEEITLSVRLYDDVCLQSRFPIRCDIDINAREGLLSLAPMAGALEKAVEDQMTALGSLLESDCDCEVFYGKP